MNININTFNKEKWDNWNVEDWVGSDMGNEISYMNKVINHIGDMSSFVMLDIGVGGGRSTSLFKDRVKEYVGVDYNESYINHCREIYTDIEFICHDVTNGIEFDSNTFDFVLFKFNGIDYCDSDSRDFVLSEMVRVCKPGGYVCLSTHNLLGILIDNDWNRNFVDFINRRVLSSSTLTDISKNGRYFFSHNYESVITCYEDPKLTEDNLTKLGLKEMSIFSIDDSILQSPYLYFIGKKH